MARFLSTAAFDPMTETPTARNLNRFPGFSDSYMHPVCMLKAIWGILSDAVVAEVVFYTSMDRSAVFADLIRGLSSGEVTGEDKLSDSTSL